MEIHIKNLCPLKDAQLEPGDITALIGPPNSGKSFTLKSLYGKLALFDLILRDQIINNITQEIDTFKRIDYFITTDLPRIVKLVIGFQDKMKSEDTRDKIINRIKEKREIEEIDIKIEDKDLVITSQKSEILDIHALAELFAEKFNSILYEILPITERTTITARGIPTPEFLPLLNEIFSSPFEQGVSTGDEKKGVQFSLKVIREMEGQDVKYTMRVETHIKAGSSIEKRLRKDISEVLGTNKTIEEIIEICLNENPFPTYVEFRSLIRLLSSLGAELSTLPFQEELRSVFNQYLNVQSVVFIPFGRSLLVYQVDSTSIDVNQWYKLLEIYEDEHLFYSYIQHLYKGRTLLIKNKFNKSLIKQFTPLLQGELIFDRMDHKLRYKKWNTQDVPIDQASALVGEILGILMPILSIPSGSWLIIEEPEAQLHYSAQILIALTLGALSKEFKYKIIFSTHSDILSITLAYLKELEYDEDKIGDLIAKLLEIQGIKVDKEKIKPLATSVSGVKDLDIKFYYYKPESNGIVEVLPIKTKDILKEVPGMTVVTDILASWALNL